MLRIPIDWVFDFVASSIGKKVRMAVTGLMLMGFLAVHLAGNLFLYVSPSAFNDYAAKLKQIPFLTLIELGLLLLFALHIAAGILVYIENWRARPKGYDGYRSSGGRTFSSALQPYTGLLVLVFLYIHMANFRLSGEEDLYLSVMGKLRSKPYALFYILGSSALLLHLNHGFQSSFQTFGIHHSKYTPLIKFAGSAVAVAFAAGFASFAFWFAFLGGGH